MGAAGKGKSRVVKKARKPSRRTKTAAAADDLQITSPDNPSANQPTTSLPPSKTTHQTSQPTTLPSQPTTLPPLSQVTASRLGLEILNHNAPYKEQKSTLKPAPISKHTSAKAGGNAIAKQKQDWLRPETPRSEAEEDRLMATQTRLLTRRFDAMREDTEEEGLRQRLAEDSGEHQPSFSAEEARTMGRAGSAMAYLKEQLEFNRLEREGLLRLLSEVNKK